MGAANEYLEFNIKPYLIDILDAINNLTALIGSTSGSTNVISQGTATTVPDSVLTTVLSYTNSTGGNVWVDKVVGTGDIDGEWRILVNSVEKVRYRTAEQWRTMDIAYPVALKLANGDILEVKVTHFNPNFSGSFESSLIGHTA